MSFVKDERKLPALYEIIPVEEIDVYSSEGSKISLKSVSNNYFANLYYSKIQMKLIDSGIVFKAVRPFTGYVGLRKEFNDGNFALFANVWFQKGGLRIDTKQPANGGIGDYKGDVYSLNFKYVIKVDGSTDIDVVVNELIESYKAELIAKEVGLEKVILTIELIIKEAILANEKTIDISAWDVQNKLGMKRAAGIICDALNHLKTEKDVVIEQTKKKTLSYKIRFDLNSRII